MKSAKSVSSFNADSNLGSATPPLTSFPAGILHVVWRIAYPSEPPSRPRYLYEPGPRPVPLVHFPNPSPELALDRVDFCIRVRTIRARDPSDSAANTLVFFPIGRAPEISPPHSQQPLPDAHVHDSAAQRYARLRQKNNQHQSAPGTIISPPVPVSVHDTSVNVASAFNQAAMSFRNGKGPDAQPENRRLAVPPARLRGKGAGGRATHSPAGDSDGEDTQPSAPYGRSKSPFDALAQGVARAVAPAVNVFTRALSPGVTGNNSTFVLREGADDSESSGFHSFGSLSGNGNGNSRSQANISNSYDYAQEEQDVENMDAEAKKAQAKRRGPRISVDNKAYKPTDEDDFDEEDFTDDDTGKRRRKKRKSNLSLPTIAYDKAKKKKPTSKKRGVRGVPDEDGASGSDRVSVVSATLGPIAHAALQGSVVRSLRGSVPPVQHQQEQDDSQIEDSGFDFGGDSMQDVSALVPLSRSARSPTPTPRPRVTGDISLESQTEILPEPRSRWFGAALGRMVRAIIDLSKSVAYFILRCVGVVFGLVFLVAQSSWQQAVVKPYNWFRTAGARFSTILPKLLQIATVGFAVYAMYLALPAVGNGLADIVRRPAPVYHAPEVPAADLAAANQRLRNVETALEKLSNQLKEVTTRSDDIARNVLAAQSQVESESRRASEAEGRLRTTASKILLDLREEIKHIQDTMPTTIDPTNALRSLEKRVTSNEADIKSIQLNPPAAPVSSGSASIPWSKTGNKAVTIRASDGTDVTSYIGSLVDNAVGLIARDGVGRPDYAQMTSGGRIIPRLTSATFVVRPSNWRRRLVGMITGYGYSAGHPPTAALHPDVSLGNCWPFEGAQGQLGVLLARPVKIDSFTIEHVPREIAFGGSSNAVAAPRHMEVWGFVEGDDNRRKVVTFYETIQMRHAQAVKAAEAANRDPPPPLEEADAPGRDWSAGHYVLLGRFEYDINKPQHLQTFSVRPEVANLDVDFGIVQLRISDNWGANFTCLYRFRVHGTEVAIDA